MTEKADEVDYGPLAGLIGEWRGAGGMDVAPEPDGTERNPFYETILFEAIGDVTNAERQVLAALRYHQVVYRQSNDRVFHNETGYWLWDSKQGLVMQTLTIPRGVSLVAGGAAQVDNAGRLTIEVQAAADDENWRIVQSPFMRDNAATESFRHSVIVDKNRLEYSETTVVDIYGRRFEHTDENVLQRAG